MISLRGNGDISVGGRIISKNTLQEIFENVKGQYSKIIIYLRIDTKCPEEKLEQIINIAKKHDAEIYQVFWSEKQFASVVKKME